ncbi:MAG: transposase [Pseudonocardia sp.]|nr:transposase [Pseudonocardia sp.]
MEELPDPQVAERATRRTYTARYKLEVLAEYEASTCRAWMAPHVAVKNIGSIRLYRPDDQQQHAALGPVLTRPIRWELIAQQYDQMIRYATALRLGTAESEQVLRRFTRGGPKHPTYAALEELGAPSSPATTSPTPSCAARSTAGCRSWRTGTRATP